MRILPLPFVFEMVLVTQGFLYITELDDGRFMFELDLVEVDLLVDVFPNP